MNKYREAFRTIERTLEYDCDKELTLIYNLVRKATPEKVLHIDLDYYNGGYTGKCPNCFSTIERNMKYMNGNRYCRCCGQALDWSD